MNVNSHTQWIIGAFVKIRAISGKKEISISFQKPTYKALNEKSYLINHTSYLILQMNQAYK